MEWDEIKEEKDYIKKGYKLIVYGFENLIDRLL